VALRHAAHDNDALIPARRVLPVDAACGLRDGHAGGRALYRAFSLASGANVDDVVKGASCRRRPWSAAPPYPPSGQAR
jgi:hypothetical protein